MTDSTPMPGWPTEPAYERPAWMPAPRDAHVQPYGQQPSVINNYYAAPPVTRRGPDVRGVLGWVAVGGIVTAALLAVATAAIAILALVVRGLWRDLHGGK